MSTITINTPELQTVGENVKAATVDNYLVIVIDISKTIGLSSTGKMMRVGSSAGFTALPGGLKGIVYVSKKAR